MKKIHDLQEHWHTIVDMEVDYGGEQALDDVGGNRRWLKRWKLVFGWVVISTYIC